MIDLRYNKMRNAFSMITAIFVIVIMASVAGFVLNLAAQANKETTAQYQHEQAILYAKSYTEFAIMAATSQDCIATITADVGASTDQVLLGDGYRVTVNVQYIGNDLPCTNTIGNAITTPNSQGAIALIDTYVLYRDIDLVDAALIAGTSVDQTSLPWITYHRRTLQRL